MVGVGNCFHEFGESSAFYRKIRYRLFLVWGEFHTQARPLGGCGLGPKNIGSQGAALRYKVAPSNSRISFHKRAYSYIAFIIHNTPCQVAAVVSPESVNRRR